MPWDSWPGVMPPWPDAAGDPHAHRCIHLRISTLGEDDFPYNPCSGRDLHRPADGPETDNRPLPRHRALHRSRIGKLLTPKDLPDDSERHCSPTGVRERPQAVRSDSLEAYRTWNGSWFRAVNPQSLLGR